MNALPMIARCAEAQWRGLPAAIRQQLEIMMDAMGDGCDMTYYRCRESSDLIRGEETSLWWLELEYGVQNGAMLIGPSLVLLSVKEDVFPL